MIAGLGNRPAPAPTSFRARVGPGMSERETKKHSDRRSYPWSENGNVGGQDQ